MKKVTYTLVSLIIPVAVLFVSSTVAQPPDTDLSNVPCPYVFGPRQCTASHDYWIVTGDGLFRHDYITGEISILKPGGDQLNGIFFATDDSGWAVGDRGTILYTADRGKSWVRQNSPTSVGLNGIFCVGTDECWIVGNKGTILRTTDRGRNWVSETTGTTNPLLAVHFIDSKVGWAVGLKETVLATADSGWTWKPFSVVGLEEDPKLHTAFARETMFRDVHFANDKSGWIVGHNGIATTNDGGKTWKWTSIDGTLDGIGSTNGTRVVAVGRMGANWCSDDSGKTWKACQ